MMSRHLGPVCFESLNRRQLVKAAALLPAMGLAGRLAASARSALSAAAQEAWIYGLPLIENAQAREEVRLLGKGPNQIVHATQLTTPANQFVTTPNNDTIYSRAWLDLSQGPVRIELPATGERYLSVALMDMYANNFAVLGTRTTGNGGGRFTLVGPDAPSSDPQAIRSPTRWVWLLARTLVSGAADLEAARAAQEGIRISGPAIVWNAHVPARRTASAADYFSSLQALMIENPPPAVDAGFFERVRPLGLGPQGGFDPGRFSRTELDEIEAGVAAARSVLRSSRRQGVLAEGWVYPKFNLGNFGLDYFYRGQVAVGGLGALPLVEAMYMRPVNDTGGHAFDSASSWALRLPKDRLPPVKAFWSLSMYRLTPDGQYFFFENPIDRYAIGDRTDGLVRGPDGAIDIWISREDPGEQRRANWLPAPRDGLFGLVFRAYLPEDPLIDGIYRLPALQRL